MSKTTKSTPLPPKLFVDLIKAIHSNIFRNEYVKIDKKAEWGNYAIKMLTSFSLIYKISERNFKYVKIYVMRDRQIICPECENIMKYKNFKKHSLNVHQKNLYHQKSYEILEELRVMVGLYKFAETQKILDAALNRFYFLEDCLKLGIATPASKRSLDCFKRKRIREWLIRLSKCKNIPEEAEEMRFLESRNALLAETDILRRELLIEMYHYEDLLYNYCVGLNREISLNSQLREINN